MSDKVRALNAEGVAAFERYLLQLRGGAQDGSPSDILSDSAYSIPFEVDIEVEDKKFSSRYEFGVYLAKRLEKANRRDLSRNCGLWSWLALYYFEQLCPRFEGDSRAVLNSQAYILPNKYDYRSYYRHLVRTPWLVVTEHGDYARLLLIPPGASEGAPLATRGEIIEQLAARQEFLGNRAIIETAFGLYFDKARGRPRRGAAGSAGGSPRRLAIILQQLGLTFDLGACSAKAIRALLPKEFDRWNV